MSKILLEVKDLQTRFNLQQGVVHAVNNVSFTVNEGEVLGIVGESGCGKSVTALSIMRLIEKPGEISGGDILFYDDDKTWNLTKLSSSELENVRGNKISMIFQDPMTSLNPVLTIGYQLTEPLRLHKHKSESEAKEIAVKLLERVGIPEAKSRLTDYPHQFSGGMRQRVMIALAVACSPKLLVADEPTTALDVTIQAQILDLIRDLTDEINTSVVIITHDLGVIAEMADQVAVMYAGHVVENAPVSRIFESPQHPYTRALMYSVPRLKDWPDRLATIEGAPPDLMGEIRGCPFEPRCGFRIDKCKDICPSLEANSTGHKVACWVAQEGGLPNA